MTVYARRHTRPSAKRAREMRRISVSKFQCDSRDGRIIIAKTLNCPAHQCLLGETIEGCSVLCQQPLQGTACHFELRCHPIDAWQPFMQSEVGDSRNGGDRILLAGYSWLRSGARSRSLFYRCASTTQQTGIERNSRNGMPVEDFTAKDVFQCSTGRATGKRSEHGERMPSGPRVLANRVDQIADTEKLVVMASFGLGLDEFNVPSRNLALMHQCQHRRGLQHPVDAGARA